MIVPLLALAAFALRAVAAGAALRYAAKHRVPFAPPSASVTVLQPVLGGDPDLARVLDANLRAIADAAFVWILRGDDAIGRVVCTAIRARYPTRDIRIVVAPSAPPDRNPKMVKLAFAAEGLATDVAVVLDDDTVMSAEGFAALVGALEDADLATGLPSYASGPGFASALVTAFVNDNAAPTYLGIAALTGPIGINGMCYALRTETLARLGGFAPLTPLLADDLAVAHAVRRSGMRIRQTAVPHRSFTTLVGARDYVRLMHRWYLFATLLLRDEPPRTTALLATLYLAPAALLLACVATTLVRPTRRSLAALGALVVARGVLAAVVRRRALDDRAYDPVASLAAELLMPFHALHATFVRTIRWRSRVYRVEANDRFVELT